MPTNVHAAGAGLGIDAGIARGEDADAGHGGTAGWLSGSLMRYDSNSPLQIMPL